MKMKLLVLNPETTRPSHLPNAHRLLPPTNTEGIKKTPNTYFGDEPQRYPPVFLIPCGQEGSRGLMGSVQTIIRMVPAHLSLDEAPATTEEGVSSLSPPPQAVFFLFHPVCRSFTDIGQILSPRVSMLLGGGPRLQVLPQVRLLPCRP